MCYILNLVETRYPFQHFTSSADGWIMTVDGATGELLWKREFGSVIVNMYLLKQDGMHKLPSTAIGKETFEVLIQVCLVITLSKNHLCGDTFTRLQRKKSESPFQT